jgi:hypothetical protein
MHGQFLDLDVSTWRKSVATWREDVWLEMAGRKVIVVMEGTLLSKRL